MKRTMGVMIVLSTLTLVGVSDISAQGEVENRRRFQRQPAVETIMQMRDRLELTDDQIAQLDVIRAETVQRRSAEAAELAELRSQLAAGQIERSDVMAFMEERRDANAGVVEQRQERIDAILTDAQRESLREMRGRAGAFVQGRMGMRGGGPGFGRGGRQFRWGGDRFQRGGDHFGRGGRQFRRGGMPGMGGGTPGMGGGMPGMGGGMPGMGSGMPGMGRYGFDMGWGGAGPSRGRGFGPWMGAEFRDMREAPRLEAGASLPSSNEPAT